MKYLLILTLACLFLLGSCLEENAIDKSRINDSENETNSNLKLPSGIPVTKGKFLTATATTDSYLTTIIYYESEKKLPLNDSEIEDVAQPIARLQIEKYATEQEANEQIAFEYYAQYGGQEVELGYNITGYQEEAAGSFWTSWNEGYWAISTHTQTSEPSKGLLLAKQAVEFLETHKLPIPKTHGRAYLDVDEKNSRIIWQEGTKVYTLDEVVDSIKLLEIATSIE
ncbi:hypothetical protein [Solibacillus sp. CAU 1738]|uniref:hypothetical protein n=1 Tax=Solibacillus sp. CAU 1738 TaxID=3140363 RepID=UPI0032618125